MLKQVLRIFLAILAAEPLIAVAWQEECNQSSAAERFACLVSLEVEHAGELDFELALADAARLSGNKAYAAIVLERVVARHPDQAGARLDLVILSLQAGDKLTASRHLKILETMSRRPPVVTSLIQQLNRELNPADKIFENKLIFQGTLGLGYDTNPNLGVYADAIDLIIDGAPVSLTPEDSISPQPAFFLGASGGVEYSYSPKGLVNVTANLREYEGLEDEDSGAIAARLFHRVRDNRFVEMVLADFRTGEGLYLSRAGVGLRQRFGGCRCSTIGLLADILDGSEKSSQASRIKLEVETTRKEGIVAYYLYGSIGYDVQSQAEWGNTAGIQFGADAMVDFGGFRGNMGASFYKGFDEDPYSPLFGDNKRNLFRGLIKAGISRPVVPGVEVFLDWSWSRQGSDIVLYDYERQVSALGLRMTF